MNPKQIAITLLLIVALAACAPTPTPAPTPDIAAISTAAAETVIANITGTAQAEPPTPLPTATEILSTDTPTVTPTVLLAITFGAGTSGPLCEVFQFVTDINYPDDTGVAAGAEFIKTWKIRNVGTCAWGAGYKVAYAGYSDKMSGAPAAITTVVQPGQEIEVSVQFKAPTKPGVYVSAWTMANPQSVNFFDDRGKPFYVKVVVR
ncbi:MAG: hypothetical protein HFACDABA_01472 [Anaerolineales bacterium]|nr:hypothetical protein [Anaerolineales bacterium]